LVLVLNSSFKNYTTLYINTLLRCWQTKIELKIFLFIWKINCCNANLKLVILWREKKVNDISLDSNNLCLVIIVSDFFGLNSLPDLRLPTGLNQVEDKILSKKKNKKILHIQIHFKWNYLNKRVTVRVSGSINSNGFLKA
jgi:hypothetical protein